MHYHGVMWAETSGPANNSVRFMCCVMCCHSQFWFAMLSGFSGQVVFERWSIGLYNVVGNIAIIIF